MKKLYPEFEGGEPLHINWRKSDLKMACCDCGLVHRMRFIVSGKRIRIRAWRDNRSTAALRRYNKFKKK